MRYDNFSNSNCPLLNISCIGCSADKDITHFGPGVRKSYILHYVLSGKGYFNGSVVTAGQGFLITPNMPEHYFADEHDPWELLWVTTDDSQMAKLFTMLNANQNSIFHYDYLDAVKELSYSLKTNKTRFCDSFEMLSIFLGILKHHTKNVLPNETKSNAAIYLDAAERYIHANLHRPISVAEVTAFLGITQPYLFRIFKECFFLSPKQYILEQKLLRAQILLAETDMSVSHVANSVGFEDALSFSRCFRSKLGGSPKGYRNQHKQDPEQVLISTTV